jgi:hypothetical protein
MTPEEILALHYGKEWLRRYELPIEGIAVLQDAFLAGYAAAKAEFAEALAVANATADSVTASRRVDPSKLNEPTLGGER